MAGEQWIVYQLPLIPIKKAEFRIVNPLFNGLCYSFNSFVG
jgi:hypothetical protein